MFPREDASSYFAVSLFTAEYFIHGQNNLPSMPVRLLEISVKQQIILPVYHNPCLLRQGHQDAARTWKAGYFGHVRSNLVTLFVLVGIH
jgi:hypothetical protein